jgi:acyl-CoA synthetase (AMP-forming)/AMP-acid ligase II
MKNDLIFIIIFFAIGLSIGAVACILNEMEHDRRIKAIESERDELGQELTELRVMREWDRFEEGGRR